MILKGTITLTRFNAAIEGAPNIDALAASIEKRRFVPLSPSSDAAESAGWAAFEAPFDDERVIDSPSFLFGERVVLAYREDKWKIDRALLKRETQKRIEKIIAEEGKDKDEIGKAFIKAVESAVLAELKAKSRPKTKIVQIEWNHVEGTLRVFGRGTIVTERIASLFERTFSAKVEQDYAPTQAFNAKPDGLVDVYCSGSPFFSSGFDGDGADDAEEG